MPSTDELLVAICSGTAERLAGTGRSGPELRETTDLDPAIKDAFMEATGKRPVSKRFQSPAFPRLGPVDVVVDEPGLLMELKWSYERPGKAFECLWDAVKLALLGPEHGYENLYIAVGTRDEEFRDGECAALFETGTIDPLELWRRPLEPRRGPNHGATVGEDLVIGARGNQPAEGPSALSLRLLDSFPVAGDFELRLVGIEGTGGLRPWPQLTLPSG